MALLFTTACTDDGGDDDIGDDSASASADTETDTNTNPDTETGTSGTDTETSSTEDDTESTEETESTEDTETGSTEDTESGSTEDTGETDDETDTDTETDTGPDPVPDSDEDGIPDPDDPFPNDPDLPGVAEPHLVYAQTAAGLFTMDPFSYEISSVGNFTYDQSPGSVTDIAIDRWGVLYAVTFNDIFVCDPETAACIYLGDLPSSFNGLTMVPPGTLYEDDDGLIGIASNGTWYDITIVDEEAQLVNLGSYGGGMTSSGDVFSIEGTGTYGAVNKPGVNNGDVIVECDPTDGTVLSELATTVGYSSLFGLAGWEGKIFGFNSGGQVILIDPESGVVTEVADSNNSWWGAGVFSVLPQ